MNDCANRTESTGTDPTVLESRPVYLKNDEATTVDLAPDSLDCIPVLGRLHYARAGGGTVPHVHPGMIEILLCRRGAGLSFEYGGKIVAFRPGTVFAAQPEVPHFLRRYPKGLSMDWILFRLPKGRGGTVLGLSAAETRWLVGRLRALPCSFSSTNLLDQSFRHLWQTYDNVPRGAVERRLLMRDAATRLLLDVVGASELRADRAVQGDVARIAEIVKDMRGNPSRDYSADELVRRAGMSVAKLTECFRRETGLPPHAFLVFCRIARAKELLTGTARSVAAIAHELGFTSSQHFATQFRRETGKTPLEWRRA